MIPDLDIYRSANLLIKQHGPDAPIQAAMRADAMLETGDLGGFAVWKRILRAVEELRRAGVRAGDRLQQVVWQAPLYRTANHAETDRRSPHALELLRRSVLASGAGHCCAWLRLG